MKNSESVKFNLMENIGLQISFFHLLKEKIPSHISLADEMAGILHISEDSAYRRIRGDKQMGFDELQLLCRHFKISLDQLLGLKTHNVLFSGRYIRPENFNFREYLKAQQLEFKQVLASREKEIIFLCKDIPVYHYFLFPEIAAFKYFSWMRTLLNFPELKNMKFSLSFMQDEIMQLGSKIAEAYYQIPGTEILNPDNILTTLRQIEYFKDAKLFESDTDLDSVFNSLERMVEHIRNMAAEGKKFPPGKDPAVSPGDYKLYVNDFYVGDNTLLVRTDNDLSCFIIHSGTNFIKTQDKAFCLYHQNFIGNIIRRSSYISIVGEKERNSFFEIINERIQAYRQNKVQTLGNY